MTLPHDARLEQLGLGRLASLSLGGVAVNGPEIDGIDRPATIDRLSNPRIEHAAQAWPARRAL